MYEGIVDKAFDFSKGNNTVFLIAVRVAGSKRAHQARGCK
jgi:hypothetical protein